MNKSNLEEIKRQKQEERAAELKKLQEKYQIEDKDGILGLNWENLVQALQTRVLTASEVLEAYMTKAIDATAKSNSITDFIPQSTDWAKELDSLELPKGPLHGIPFCVKDDTDVEGLDSTLGYAKRLYQPATESAVLVRTLMDLGAIPFCKTNVPQTLFSYGSDNPVFGKTLNFINPKLSPGGSSSGTGSLVGAHGCMFGTGTDIGGSLRIPAHFNGVASIKPTVGRLSNVGVVCSLPNLVGITAVPGIIGQSPSVVSAVFKGLTEGSRQADYDPQALPIPWNDVLFKSEKKLRIGYFSTLPFFPAMGDTENVLLHAKSSLMSLGHTLVPFAMPNQYNYMRTIGNFVLADNGKHFSDTAWKGEPPAEAMSLAYLASWIPLCVQKVVGSLMMIPSLSFLYSPRAGVWFGAGASSSTDLWDATGRKNDIIRNILDEWESLNLDAVISPVFPFAAPLVNAPGMIPTAVAYAMIWNLVDFPAGVVPFGEESGNNVESYDTEGDNTLILAKESLKESAGAPIGVQVISLPYKEEVVLRVMCELENASKKLD